MLLSIEDFYRTTFIIINIILSTIVVLDLDRSKKDLLFMKVSRKRLIYYIDKIINIRRLYIL